MKKVILQILVICTGLLIASCGQNKTNNETETHSENIVKNSVEVNTPDDALAEMKAGNKRFLDGKLVNTDYKNQIEQTKDGQHPHTIVLTCIDSRTPPEIVFDQGIGNIFVARVAGNIEDPNILGSMEYAVKVVGSKLIVVMGHNNCGAVKGAIDNVELGNLTQLVDQIKPAIVGDTTNIKDMVNETSKNNIKLTIEKILKSSPVIDELVKENKIKIVGAYYDVTSGEVTFLE
ncbi:MAG: carbonic anhydrase [Ignavibacteria bacterium]|nr:carbonic anhydrase [Ignavibacteria bacterium]